MGDLISREALIAEIKRVYCTGCNDYCGVRCRACGTDDALDMVEDAPAADAEPVKHGKWIPNGDDDMDAGMWHCSECGHEIYSDLALIEEIQEQGYALYCEHCGAKMEGGL